MPTANECRIHAAEERDRSDHATLPNIRQQHQQSAEKWESLAEKIDHCCRGLVRAKGIERDLFY